MASGDRGTCGDRFSVEPDPVTAHVMKGEKFGTPAIPIFYRRTRIRLDFAGRHVAAPASLVVIAQPVHAAWQQTRPNGLYLVRLVETLAVLE